jgi:hypothetical protein
MNKFLVSVVSLALAGAFGQGTAARKTFGSPEEAIQAAIQAAKSGEPQAMLQVLGPEGKDLISSGDPVEDKNNLDSFVQKMAKWRTEPDPLNADRVLLVAETDNWPFPIPIVRKNGAWSFATDEGRDEILARRIGANEFAAIRFCRTFVEAQEDYASTAHDGGMLEYAQVFLSNPGKHDGLYWKAEAGQPPSPFADEHEQAESEGYGKAGNTHPYHGYFFKMLKGQGSDASGGARDYVVRGHQIGGYALILWPAEYMNSGVQTFIVNQDGVVWEKDLGSTTVQAVKAITRYNPDKTWKESLDPDDAEGAQP